MISDEMGKVWLKLAKRFNGGGIWPPTRRGEKWFTYVWIDDPEGGWTSTKVTATSPEILIRKADQFAERAIAERKEQRHAT